MRHLWTDGDRLASATADQLREQGQTVALDNPWFDVASVFGAAGARALLAVIKDAVPGYTMPPVGWRPLRDADRIVVWSSDGHRVIYDGTAGHLAEIMAGLLAIRSGERWVRL